MTEERSDNPDVVVGIGASAGGLRALQDFFSNVPSETGVAFVVITHQAHQDHSMLPGLLAEVAELPVEEINTSIELRPGVVYVQVGGHEVAVRDDRLELTEVDTPKLAVIDRFFRSLADAKGPGAIAVLLSGGGSDGTLGAKAIKAASGMVMAQEPSDAEHADMVTSVIASGVVDFVAPAANLPAHLTDYLEGPFFGGRHSIELGKNQKAVLEMFEILRAYSGTDFGEYKQTTIRRRVERRMNMRRVSQLPDYVELLKREPSEVASLFHELLIGVTSFFRDPEAWEALASEALLPLIKTKEHGDTLRAWVPGCSTGEEAYTLAILLTECAASVDVRLDIQVFGTDLNPLAIDAARAARYPSGIADDVSEERLTRYFDLEDSNYRVVPRIREKVVFATQNVLEDPPFSRMDVICCRNMLIYFLSGPRRRLLPMFHYALIPDGILFLGPSETLGGSERLFETVDKSARIFRRADVSTDSEIAAITPFAHGRSVAPLHQRAAGARPVAGAERLLLDELTPPSVLCTLDGKVIHVHGRTGKYLEPSPGPQVSVNLVDMARHGLRFELSALLREAWDARPELVRQRNVPVQTNGSWGIVTLVGRGIERPGGAAGRIAIGFLEEPVPPPDETSDGEGQRPTRLVQLEAEVRDIRGKRQTAIEELEVANEELRSMNEELQSTNEELQSSNEELKTSKEEVQSLNEELRTVNQELQRKVELLSRANDDMSNLLNGTEIATLFLDNQLRIKRYTETATSLIRLIPSDEGRSISDLSMEIDADTLVRQAQEVLDTLQVGEFELCDRDGRWFQTRVVPYRTAENVIDGLVITFVEITALKKLQGRYDRLVNDGTTSETIDGATHVGEGPDEAGENHGNE